MECVVGQASGAPGARTAAARLRGFARCERGSFTIFTLYLILAMLIICGVSVDVMRFEAKRTRVQNTLDRAVLAAADMSQTLTAAQVVHSYFEKAGLVEYYNEPHTTVGFNSKEVSGTASGQLDTFF